MKKNIIFLDGQFMKADHQLITSLSPGILSGKGVFETMLVRNKKIFTFKQHFQRFLLGLKKFHLNTNYSSQEIKNKIYELLRLNQLKDAKVRLCLWQEKKRLRIYIVVQPVKRPSSKIYKKGFKAIVSKIKRNPSKFSHIKSMDYQCFRSAFLEAEQKGFDEALLFNSFDEIVEGARTNIFFIKDNIVFTPALPCGCLDGITRKIVMQCLKKMNIRCKTVQVKIQSLLEADEAFLTNSIIGVMPLTFVDDKKIGNGQAGPITAKIFKIYNRVLPTR